MVRMNTRITPGKPRKPRNSAGFAGYTARSAGFAKHGQGTHRCWSTCVLRGLRGLRGHFEPRAYSARGSSLPHCGPQCHHREDDMNALPADRTDSVIELADALDWLARQERGTARAIIYDPPYSRYSPMRGAYIASISGLREQAHLT